jgi:hypothetical protein
MLQDTKHEQTFQLSPTLRVVADYSSDHEGVQEVVEMMDLGIQTIRVARGLRQYNTDDTYRDGIQEVIGDCLYKGIFERIHSAIRGYLKYDIPFIIKELRGYSQGEWHEVVIYDPKNVWTEAGLEGVYKELNAIFAGEVYRVWVQSAKVYTANDGDTITEWVGNDDYEAIEVTQELFQLNAEWVYDNYKLEVELPEK